VIARHLGHVVVRVSLAEGLRTRYRHADQHMHLCEAMIALAGPITEARYRPTTRAERHELWRGPWHIDLENARRHVEAGGGDGQWIARQVRALVRKRWPAIVRVAAALRERSTLTSAELDALMHS
jgi:hypothetical protein